MAFLRYVAQLVELAKFKAEFDGDGNRYVVPEIKKKCSCFRRISVALEVVSEEAARTHNVA